MYQAAFRLRLNRWLLLTALVAGATPWLIGCGEADKGPITAQRSQYQVDGDDAGSGSAVPSPANSVNTTPAPAPEATGQTPGVRVSDLPNAPNSPGSSGDAAGRQAPTPQAPATEGQPAMPPAFDSAGNLDLNNLDPNSLPNDEAKLLALLDVLQVRQPQGRTQQEQLEDYIRIQHTQVEVAEKLWNLPASKEGRSRAVQTKLTALRVVVSLLRQVSPGEAVAIEKKLNTYCRNLQQNEDPEFASIGRLMLFRLAVDDLAMGRQVEMQALLEEMKNLATDSAANENTFGVISQAADMFLQLGQRDAAIETYRTIGESFKDSEDKELAADALVMLERVRILDAGMDTKLQAAATDQPGSEAPVLETIDNLLAAEGAGTGTLLEMGQAGAVMEMTDHYELAGQIYEKIAAAYSDHPDAELASDAAQLAANGLKHVDLIGKPLNVTGVTLDGSPFDWSAYKGKVVLVSFWTLNEACLYEIQNIVPLHRQFRDEGFDVVGVNLDEDRRTVQQIMDIQPLPWTVLVSDDPEKQGTQNPLAVRCGVDLLPFGVLVGRDGNVVALHVRQQRLQQKLQELLGPPAGAEPGVLPGKQAPTQPPAAQPAPAAPAPAADRPPTGDQSRRPDSGLETFFVSLQGPAAEEPAEEAENEETANKEAAEEEAAEIEQINPYRPQEGLTPDELVDFIFTMQDKPASIQDRPGFGAALIEAADRILAAETTDKNRRIAAETKFDLLHGKACLGDEKAEAELVKFVEQMKDTKDEKIAEHVRFFQLERTAVIADDLPLDKVPDLLAEMKKYLSEQKLVDRHLRMASSTVRAINRLEDADKREEYFQQFGELFAKSDSKELARYGKKLAKKPGVEMPDLVGKPLALAGVTALGTEFDWESYRGKVVLVDFWATWCGPCRAAMPHVKQLHTELRDKGFDVVGVNLDTDQEQLAKYVDENEIPWANVIGDEALEAAKKYGVRAIPTMILVDRDGIVVAASNKLEALKPALDRLVTKTP